MILPRPLRLVLARKPWRPRSFRLRARADAARRAGDYPTALGLYRQYLALRPDHAMGWVMLGHMLKETGDRPGAGEAYARAVALDPHDPFIALQLAHFLKLEGRAAEALDAFRAAVALTRPATPMGEEARREAVALLQPGLNPDPAAGTGTATCWVDVSDLLAYLMDNQAVSGIQRVQAALAAHALGRPTRLVCVMTRPWSAGLWAIPRDAMAQVLRLAEHGQGATPAMRAALERAITTAAPAPPVPGAVLLCSGAFWLAGGNPPLWAALRHGGMRLVVLVHDLIPLTMPEVCVPALVREFTLAWAELSWFADGFLANSDHTAASVRDNLRAHARPALPVVATPLAHGIRAGGAEPRWTRPIRALRGKRFVLSVGTIEARKNHAFLVRVWDALRREGLAPPPLVLAGKPGWQRQAFDAAMAETRAAGGRVRVISGLSDAEIETLYDACLFTVFPSLLEGWGLPVGESLARGKLCVASDRGSLPEAGGGFALYLDPEDVAAALPLFRRLLTDPTALAEAEARIAQGFRPRDWPEVAASMAAAAEAMAPSPHPIPEYPLLPAGVPVTPWPIPGPDPFEHPLRAMLLEGWERPGSHGARMLGARAPLRFDAAVAGVLRVESQDGAQEFPVPAGPQQVVLEGPMTLRRLELVAPPPTGG